MSECNWPLAWWRRVGIPLECMGPACWVAAAAGPQRHLRQTKDTFKSILLLKVLSCDADKWRADKASKPRGRALHNRLGMFQAVPVLGGRDVANGCSTPTRPGSSLRISRVSIASGLSSLVCLTWGLVKPVTWHRCLCQTIPSKKAV